MEHIHFKRHNCVVFHRHYKIIVLFTLLIEILFEDEWEQVVQRSFYLNFCRKLFFLHNNLVIFIIFIFICKFHDEFFIPNFELSLMNNSNQLLIMLMKREELLFDCENFCPSTHVFRVLAIPKNIVMICSGKEFPTIITPIDPQNTVYSVVVAIPLLMFPGTIFNKLEMLNSSSDIIDSPDGCQCETQGIYPTLTLYSQINVGFVLSERSTNLIQPSYVCKAILSC